MPEDRGGFDHAPLGMHETTRLPRQEWLQLQNKMNVPTHLSELSFCTYWSVMKAGEIFNQDLFYQLGFCDDQR